MEVCGPEADVAHQISDIGEGLGDVSGLHRQHILYRRAAQLLLQKRHHVHQLFRVLVADIVDPRRRTPGGRLAECDRPDAILYGMRHRYG